MKYLELEASLSMIQDLLARVINVIPFNDSRPSIKNDQHHQLPQWVKVVSSPCPIGIPGYSQGDTNSAGQMESVASAQVGF